MRNQKLTTGLCLAGALGLAAPTISQAEGACPLYGVNDGGLNNSQLFTVNPDTHEVEKLGSLHEGKDIEALAINKTGVLYAASGDDTDKPGHLYTVDKGTGALTDLGSTGFDEIEGLTFDSDGKLWAWAKGDGLISIDPSTPPSSTLVLPSNAKVEDITWNPEGTHIYGSQNTNLWVYEPTTGELEKACSNLPGETEALEMLPDGRLLLGIHGKRNYSIPMFDVGACEMIAGGVDIPISSSLNDVEGIAWQSCGDGNGETESESEPSWVLWDGNNVEGSFKLYEGEWRKKECEYDVNEDDIRIFKTDEDGMARDDEGKRIEIWSNSDYYGVVFDNYNYYASRGAVGGLEKEELWARRRRGECLVVFEGGWSTTTD